jgi:hypothetical protein
MNTQNYGFEYIYVEPSYYNYIGNSLLKIKSENALTYDEIKKLLGMYFNTIKYKDKEGKSLTGPYKHKKFEIDDEYFNKFQENFLIDEGIEEMDDLKIIIFICIKSLENLCKQIVNSKSRNEIDKSGNEINNDFININKITIYMHIIMVSFGYHYMCIYPLINLIKNTVNNVMGNNYVEIKCRGVTEFNSCNMKYYTCGRAITINYNFEKSNTKIYIHNIMSDVDMDPDEEYINEVIKENNIIYGGLLTDDNDYYPKYLKYKNKYLNLKKMKNI